MSSRVLHSMFFGLAALALLPELAACGEPTVNAAQPQQTVTIVPGFQARVSPVPTIPPYRCGAWSSNNAPDRFSTITIYSRLMHEMGGVEGKNATATVHFVHKPGINSN